MLLNDKQAEERLNSPNNLANRIAAFRQSKKLQLDEPSSTLSVSAGRQLPRLPSQVREEIIERASTGLERQKDLAQEFGVTQAAVSYLKRTSEESASIQSVCPPNQAVSTPEQEKFLESSIKDIASQKMLLAMGLITEDRLEKMKATDLARISSDMAKVVRDVSPKVQSGTQINLVVYSPEVRSESSYKIVEIEQR